MPPIRTGMMISRQPAMSLSPRGEKIEAGRFYPIQIRDEEQTADVMTKPLHADKHRRHTKEMNISPV
jgi:hypothetical protein